ncbi:MAG: acyl-CoA mutase large subunit family protein [Opitutales bacterium]|nr:acyl-CoA mutase large subunit family protein [Opitutales bacterium]
MNSEDQPQTRDSAALNLLENFQPHTYEEWKAAAEALLKGRPFDKTLRSPTVEGITLEPIYRREDIAGLEIKRDLPGMGGRVRGAKADGFTDNAWEISQELALPTPEEFNKAILTDLARGQSEVNIPLDAASRAGIDADKASVGEVGVGGMSLSSLADLEKALEGVHMGMISTFIQSGASGLPALAMMAALAEKRGEKLEELRGCVESDPLGVLAAEGKLPLSLEEAYNEMAVATGFAAENAPKLQTIGVSSMPYSDGGASAVEELGYAMATAAEYVRELGERGLSIDEVAPRIRFTLSIGSNFFMEIAKLRAARVLWSRIVEAFGGKEESRSIYIHARGAKWNKSQLDPYTNMLRSTTESFSGAIGGVNGMHTSLFDETFASPEEFSRRIARNQQVILQEECELTRTIDPAGGSYYVEWLTDQLAGKAWERFQKIEELGGMSKALESGAVAEQVAKLREERYKKIQQRRDELVGVNAYPNTMEKGLEIRLPDPAAVFAARSAAVKAARKMDSIHMCGCCSCSVVSKLIEAAGEGATIGAMSELLREGKAEIEKPVVAHRASEQYEELRAASIAYAAKNGHAPQILQANMGASRAYRIRADWTSAFFNAAGIQMLNEVDFKTVEDAVKAAVDSKAKVVVITSSDDNYATYAVDTAKALKALPETPYVMLAGAATPETELVWKDAGIDEYVNVRANNYALNRKMLVLTGALEK